MTLLMLLLMKNSFHQYLKNSFLANCTMVKTMANYEEEIRKRIEETRQKHKIEIEKLERLEGQVRRIQENKRSAIWHEENYKYSLLASQNNSNIFRLYNSQGEFRSEDPVTDKLYRLHRRSGYGRVARSIFYDLVHLIEDRKMIEPVYNYLANTNINTLLAEFKSLSLKPFARRLSQRKLAKSSKRNGILAKCKNWKRAPSILNANHNLYS